MDKAAFFAALALKSETVRIPGTEIDIQLNELSAGARERLFERCKGKGPHFIAAYAVAESCPDFEGSDVDRLMSEIKTDALMFLSERVFNLSGVTEDAVDEAKKD
jgi:hypothetical protein